VGTIWKSFPDCGAIDSHELSFVLLNTLYFSDCFLDVKAANILPELTRFQLCEIKDIVDEEGQNLGARL